MNWRNRSDQQMGRMVRSCMQSLLKVVNSAIGIVGIAMILYSLWMIRDWQRNMDHGPTPAPWFPIPSSPTPAPWFMYTFLALGITLCVITCSGHIAAETANGCYLYCYMAFVFFLLVLEVAVTADVFLNYKWEEDFPEDPTGNFNEFKDFIKKNFETCKWIGLSVVCVQCLCMLLAMILRALGPHPERCERCYDSDDDYTPDRVPLLKNYVYPGIVVGDPVYGSKNDSWNVRIKDENGENRSMPDVKPRITDELPKSKIWKLTEISEPSQLRSLRLPDNLLSVRIIRLIYTNSGGAILALAYNAVHKLWRWQRNDRNLTGKATTSVPPQLWQPSSGILMTNDISDTNLEDAVPCFALSKNDSYVISALGGKISLFNMMTFKTMTTFMPPPPAATFLAFHPQDNNIIAIGMEDSSIQIYNVRVDEVKSKLKGHKKRVTGLAFSNVLNVLVSSGADAQLCVWSTDGWEKQASKFLQLPAGRTSTPLAQTRVHFHRDQVHLLAVHETQLAIHEAPKLDCVKQWVPQESSVSITDAAYSCDSESIFASFGDGSVCVFSAATLGLRCRISPTAYLPSSPSTRAYPLVVAAHPTEPSQFALGLTDGGVHVLEPLEAEAN